MTTTGVIDESIRLNFRSQDLAITINSIEFPDAQSIFGWQKHFRKLVVIHEFFKGHIAGTLVIFR